MMQISEKAKKIVAAIVFIGILISVAAWAGYSIGKDQGIAYQKGQPVILHIESQSVDSVPNIHIVDEREVTIPEPGAIMLSTGSRYVRENNISQYRISISQN